MKQASAWGQFWFDLSSVHRVTGGAIFTPLCTHIDRPAHRGAYHSIWMKHTDKGAIYYHVDGDTMTDMLLDGLRKTGSASVRMKLALIAVVCETLTTAMEKRL